MAPISLTQEAVIFLWNFFSHWQVYAIGGAVTGIVGVWQRLSGKSISKRTYVWTLVITFSMAAFCMAWHEQFEQAQRLELVLRTSQVGQSYK